MAGALSRARDKRRAVSRAQSRLTGGRHRFEVTEPLERMGGGSVTHSTSGQLPFHEPGVETDAIHFLNAVLLFAEMALANTRQLLPLKAGQSSGEALLMESVQLPVEMVHQPQQGIAVLDLLLTELIGEPTHRALLRIF